MQVLKLSLCGGAVGAGAELTSLKSMSMVESQAVETIVSMEDSYWVQKVDKLMQDKKQVIQLIKKKNAEIRASEQKNRELSQELK